MVAIKIFWSPNPEANNIKLTMFQSYSGKIARFNRFVAILLSQIT